MKVILQGNFVQGIRAKPNVGRPAAALLALPQHRALRSHRRPCFAASSEHGAQEKIKQARSTQIQATDLLARLLQAGDQQAVAREHVDSLTQEFFTMSNVYLDMAKKEGDPQVTGKLEQAINAAWAEKQKTLRPEIQLLNQLVACKSSAERQKVFNASDTADILKMNDHFFFKNMLDPMIEDVAKSQQNPTQKDLLQQLRELRKEAQRCVLT